MPGFIAGSPVSPTFVRPLASSLNRFGSPSNPVEVSKEPAGWSVLSTTISWSIVPALVIRKLTLPAGAKGWDSSMDIFVDEVSARVAVMTGTGLPYPSIGAEAAPPP